MRRALALVAAAAAAAGLSAYAATRPDPNAQAQADGCVRELAGLVKLEVPNWAYVNDKDAPPGGPPPPPQWARGIVDSPVRELAAHPAGVDDPFVHSSYDFNFNLRPDPEYAFLLGGDEAKRTGNFAARSTSLGGEEEEGEQTGRLHAEWEEAVLPSFVWPEAGDRVDVLGSWVWDCGHWLPGGERTELHPYRAIWVQRSLSSRSPYGEAEGDLLVSTEKTKAGQQADCAHRAKGDRAAFKACLTAEPDWQDVSGRYRFFLPVPPRPGPKARLRVRVLDAGSEGAPTVTVRPGARGVTVSLEIAAPAGKRVVVAKRIRAGWAPLPAARLPQHLRLTFVQLLVRRAMDPGCPNARPGCGSVETTREDQISAAPGEWIVYWDVAGVWGRWAPALLRVRGGQVVRGRQALDLYVPRGKPWRFLTYARECDFGAVHIAPCPPSGEFANATGDDVPGVAVQRFPSPAASLGPQRVNALLAGSSCPTVNSRGCYQVTYRVELLDDAARRAAAWR